MKKYIFFKLEIGESDNCIYEMDLLEADKILNLEEYETINM